MGPLSYMRFVVDRNIVMRRIPVFSRLGSADAVGSVMVILVCCEAQPYHETMV
jgi:hypothetical protein